MLRDPETLKMADENQSAAPNCWPGKYVGDASLASAVVSRYEYTILPLIAYNRGYLLWTVAICVTVRHDKLCPAAHIKPLRL